MPKYKIHCQISAVIEAESEEVARDMLETEVSFGMADVEVLVINSIEEAQ